MTIQKVDPNREAFSDYQLVEKTLTIAGISVDLEAEQEDQEKVITFTRCGKTGNIVRGMVMPCCQYLAEIIIPPRKYEEVEVEDEPVTPPKGKPKGDEEVTTHTEIIPLPLDIESVIFRTWPVEAQEETNSEEETDSESEGEGEENAE